MMWLFAIVAAYAGSASGPGLPVQVGIEDEFVPMTHVGIEGGGELLIGSNGGALKMGPSTRVWADIQDTNQYRVQLGWGWTGHALGDASKLFGEDVSIAADDAGGYVSTHTLSAGAKVMPLAQEKKSSVRLIDPWLYSGAGVSFAFAQVAWKGISEPVSTMKSFLVLEGAAGLDIRPIKSFSVTPSLRLAYHPGLRHDAETGKFSYENQLGIQPGLGVAGHF